MQCHIVYDSDIASDLKNLLEADDLAVVLSSKHRPRCIIGFIAQSLQSLNLEGTILSQLVIILQIVILLLNVIKVSSRLHLLFLFQTFPLSILEVQCK